MKKPLVIAAVSSVVLIGLAYAAYAQDSRTKTEIGNLQDALERSDIRFDTLKKNLNAVMALYSSECTEYNRGLNVYKHLPSPSFVVNEIDQKFKEIYDNNVKKDCYLSDAFKIIIKDME